MAPRDLGRRSPLVGKTVDLQVAEFVEETEGFEDWRKGIMPDDWFLILLSKRLPFRFLGPWEGLCEADLDELEAEERADDDAARESVRRDSSGRILPGMVLK